MLGWSGCTPGRDVRKRAASTNVESAAKDLIGNPINVIKQAPAVWCWYYKRHGTAAFIIRQRWPRSGSEQGVPKSDGDSDFDLSGESFVSLN